MTKVKRDKYGEPIVEAPKADKPEDAGLPANATFKERIAATRTTRWVRFGIVAAIFVAWVAWLGSWWVLLFLPLLFDIYITGYIPLTWWKRSPSKSVRYVMGWVDAIVYALVLVYFVFTFVGQNYQIPSSSLEKTLLTGDYLVVNKMAYGPRVPMTPIHFPLVQHTFPIIDTKSYVEWPQWRYHRLKGLGNVERGDIVVFNFPAGDTVALKAQNPDYYTLVKMYGRNAVNNDKETFGDIIYRPVDRRENYVKRAIGLPGDRLKIVDGAVYINGEAIKHPDNAQFNYIVQTTRPITEDEFEDLGIAVDDRAVVNLNNPNNLQILQANGITPAASPAKVYILPLTAAMVKSLEASGHVATVKRLPALYTYSAYYGSFMGDAPLYPDQVADDWTRADYGEIWIPKKGATIRLTPQSWAIYNRCIRNYEHHDDAYLNPADGKVYIDGKPQERYTFEMDYYFMMGDNRDNSLDSRYWGFVPEDHIVGRPELVLISFDKDKSLFNGGIRWDRVFKKANPEKGEF